MTAYDPSPANEGIPMPVEDAPLPVLPAERLAALHAARVTIAGLRKALSVHLTPVAVADVHRFAVVRKGGLQAIAAMGNLLETHPKFHARTTAAGMRTAVAEHLEARSLARELDSFGSVVGDTARVTLDGVWHDTMDVYAWASREADKDGDVRAALQPVRELLRVGKQAVAALATATTKLVKADIAHARAAKASEKAAKARAKAVSLVPAMDAHLPRPKGGG